MATGPLNTNLIQLNPYSQRPCHVHDDPYTPVKIWQLQWEFETLLKIYKEARPLFVLEIGSASGGTLYHWLKNARDAAVVISVDMGSLEVEQWQGWAKDTAILRRIDGNSRLESTYQAVKDVLQDYKPVLGPTPLIDFLFIDGDHSYAGVLSDFVLYGGLVRKGGIIALHDILPHPHTGVPQLWKEIQHAGYTTRELVCNPDTNDAMGIGVVFL